MQIVHRLASDSFENGLGHATGQRIEAQYANAAQTDQNQAQQATTWGECDDTWQCPGTTRKNIRCQRLTQAMTGVARGATPALWASLVDNHLPESITALFAPQNGPSRELATPMDHLLGVKDFRIDIPASLSGQALRSENRRGALLSAVNAKFPSRAPASKSHSRSPGIFKMFCLDLEAIW